MGRRRHRAAGRTLPAGALAVALVAAALFASPGLHSRAAAAGTGRAGPAPVSQAAADTIVEGEGVSSVIIPLSTLRAEAPGTRITAVGLRYQGTERAYLVIAPARVRGPLPLVVKLAGSGSEPTFEADRDELYRLAMQGRAIVVYPAEHTGSWNLGTGGCCGDTVRTDSDDTGFVLNVLDRAQRTLPVQPGPARLMGYSSGGKLGYLLLCRQPARFRSFTAVSAATLTGCPTLLSPVPFQLLVGAHDPELPSKTAPIDATEAMTRTAFQWRTRDRCRLPFAMTVSPVATIVTSPCAAGSRVQTVLYTYLSHSWPTVGRVGRADSALALFEAFTGL